MDAMSKSDQLATRFWTEPLHLPAESWVFLLLNLADLLVTNTILNHRDQWGYESNPVARYWHGQWGLYGLVFLKFTLVAVVLVICQMIHRYRPTLARRLLVVCCIIVCLVVCYGLTMVITYEVVSDRPTEQTAGQEPEIRAGIQRPIMYLMLSSAPAGLRDPPGRRIGPIAALQSETGRFRIALLPPMAETGWPSRTCRPCCGPSGRSWAQAV